MSRTRKREKHCRKGYVSHARCEPVSGIAYLRYSVSMGTMEQFCRILGPRTSGWRRCDTKFRAGIVCQGLDHTTPVATLLGLYRKRPPRKDRKDRVEHHFLPEWFPARSSVGEAENNNILPKLSGFRCRPGSFSGSHYP